MEAYLGLSIILISIIVFLLYLQMQSKVNRLNKIVRIQEAIKNSAIPVIIATDSKGIITFFNQGSQALLGYSEEEVVGKMSMIELCDPTEILERKEFLLKIGHSVNSDFEALVAFNKDFISTTTEWNLKARRGHLIRCLQSVILVKDKKQQVEGFLFIGNDLTERIRWEHKLEMAQEQAESANQAKSQFFAHMSHDLRAPLNSIIGFSNILNKNKNGNLDNQQIFYIQRVIENGKVLLNLIDEILNLNKIEVTILNTHAALVDLAPFIKNIISFLESKAKEKGIELIVDIPDALKPLKTDPEKLRDILHNLIGNAIKYTERGHVIINVKMDPQTKEAVQIDVSDTGIGIEEHHKEKIFEPFYQIDNGFARYYGGEGLGLSIVQSLCRLLGYQIKLKSLFNHGSTFSIVLHPIKEDQIQIENDSMDPSITEKSIDQDFQDLTILVVDSDDESRTILAHEFEENGCHVLQAATGKEALRLAGEQPVHLITIEMLMNPMNGYDIVKALQENQELKQIPFAFISHIAKDIQGKVPRSLAYLAKPVSVEDVKNLLQKCIARKGN